VKISICASETFYLYVKETRRSDKASDVFARRMIDREKDECKDRGDAQESGKGIDVLRLTVD